MATPQGVPQFPCSIQCLMKWDDKEIPFQRILEKEDIAENIMDVQAAKRLY